MAIKEEREAHKAIWKTFEEAVVKAAKEALSELHKTGMVVEEIKAASKRVENTMRAARGK